MSTIRSKKDRSARFVQLFSSMLEDPNLSLKAKGFIGYCMSKPDDWVFYIKQLASVLKEKEKAIEGAVNECIKLGYAIRFQTRKENGDFGSWETIISDSKEEIKRLKEEMKSTGEFQKIFTEGRFAQAHFAEAQKDPLLIKKETKKEETKKDCIVACTREKKREKEKKIKESITYTNGKGEKNEISSSQIFRHFVKFPYSTNLITKAISIANEYNGPINDILKFLEGICKNLSIVKNTNEKTEVNQKETKQTDTKHKRIVNFYGEEITNLSFK